MQVIPTPRFFSPIFLEDTPCLNVFQGRGTFCAAVPKLSIKLSCVSADGSAKTQQLVYILDYAKSAPPTRVCFRPVYIITQLVGVCQELSQTFLKKLIHRLSTGFPQNFHRLFYLHAKKNPYNTYYEKRKQKTKQKGFSCSTFRQRCRQRNCSIFEQSQHRDNCLGFKQNLLIVL